MAITIRAVGVSLVFLGTAACSARQRPQPETPSPALASISGFYSTAQAQQGRDHFQSICSECHDTRDFRGPDFEWTWRRQTVWDLYEAMVETMPEDAPGSLSPQTYAAIIAYILQINEYAAGNNDLIPEQQAMDSVPLGPNVDKTRMNDSASQ